MALIQLSGGEGGATPYLYDTESGLTSAAGATAPNTYGGRITYKIVNREGLEGAVVSDFIVTAIDGYPAASFKVEPDGQGGLRTFNPKTNAWETGGQRVDALHFDAQLPILPPSIGQDFGGFYVYRNAGATNSDFVGDVLIPFVVGAIATAGAASILGPVVGLGSSAAPAADAATLAGDIGGAAFPVDAGTISAQWGAAAVPEYTAPADVADTATASGDIGGQSYPVDAQTMADQWGTITPATIPGASVPEPVKVDGGGDIGSPAYPVDAGTTAGQWGGGALPLAAGGSWASSLLGTAQTLGKGLIASTLGALAAPAALLPTSSAGAAPVVGVKPANTFLYLLGAVALAGGVAATLKKKG